MTEEIVYAGAFRRSAAAAIDVIIVGFIRIVTAQILGMVWFNNEIISFLTSFKEKFGTDIIGRNPEHLNYLLHHSVFISTIIFYAAVVLVGAFYHALLNSSSWSATIGKRLMGVILIKSEGEKLSLALAFGHYFLSLVPWIFMIYIGMYQAFHNVTIYNAIMGNSFNLIFGLLTLGWLQIHMITKRKVTAHDLICNTIMVEGRIGTKYPRLSFK
jgi:uncharacterized RDD family membrane protein YckC